MDKRRFFSKPYIVFFIILFVFPCISKDVICADWTSIEKMKEASWYYDAESIRFLRNNIILVWAKIIPDDEDDRIRHLKRRKKEQIGLQHNYSYSLILNEINCEDKTTKMLQIIEYNNKGEVIKIQYISNRVIQYNVPGSIEDRFQKTICSLKDLKKKRR
jgi:hypothetical protein